jgi:hypothetical protein
MIIKDLNINKLLFTAEELKTVESLLNSGQSKHIMSALINVDPEKEAELQRIMNKMNPIDDGFESEVRKKMNKKLPNGPQSPEEEAQWNKLLQEEYSQWVDAQEAKRKEIEDSLAHKDALKEEKTEDDKTITTTDKSVSEVNLELLDNIKKQVKVKKEQLKLAEEKNDKELIKTLKNEINNLKKEIK